MRAITFFICLVILTGGSAGTVRAQTDWNKIDVHHAVAADTITRQGYTLVFINQNAVFDPWVQQRMIGCFFTVYPKQVKLYNRQSLKQVIIIIDTAYKGVAATDNGIVRVNPEWMRQHPEDIDVVTHEVMHIVQSYPEDAGPGWVTEGIADYVRYRFGVNNAAAGWSLPAYNEKQRYDNAYRITARFFVWIEQHHTKGVVVKLDKAMRTKTYTDYFWKKTTGKTIDELWAMYAKSPAI